MAVGKGSMARASKAVKKAAEPVEEVKPVVAEEVKVIEETKEIKKEEKKPVAKKRTTKKPVKVEKIPTEEVTDGMIAIGEEMPVYYL